MSTNKQHSSACVWEALNAHPLAERSIHSPSESFPLQALTEASALEGGSARLAGRSVLVWTAEQLTAALAFIELDGVARRIVLCPPGLEESELPAICEKTEADAIITDRARAAVDAPFNCEAVSCSTKLSAPPVRPVKHETEWVLFTSGTTGAPKLVSHSFAGLSGAITGPALQKPHIWATFYDIRRYGGLQIFLRAMLGNASLVLSSSRETVSEHLIRLGKHAVTHISGTPSHWRRVLMSPAATSISPRVVRLSGEIADQAILDGLRSLYQNSSIGHAYASTEAGVGFEVNDGLAGFPASYLNRRDAEVEMKVEDGCLFIRSKRTAAQYVGNGNRPLLDGDGFVNTGDMVEEREGRYYFTGRRDGVINVGGLKVHPEEVETVINRHPAVSMSLVKTQKNPITGAIVVADVVLRGDEATKITPERRAVLQKEILGCCRENLAKHKVPAFVRFLPALGLTAGGKLARYNA